MTHPGMRIKVVYLHHDIRIPGRIVGVQSTEQSVRHLLTLVSLNVQYKIILLLKEHNHTDNQTSKTKDCSRNQMLHTKRLSK